MASEVRQVCVGGCAVVALRCAVALGVCVSLSLRKAFLYYSVDLIAY